MPIRREKLEAYIFELSAAIGISFCALDIVAIIEELVGIYARQIFLLFSIAAHSKRFLDQAAI
jgi:hypothetical protein